MALIELETFLPVDQATAFDLARSVDLHLDSASATREYVVSGRKTGLVELGDRIRWRAKHFGVWQELEVEITALDYPRIFVDEQIDGSFAYLRHEHRFTPVGEGGTLMHDHFAFAAPFGPIGKLVDRFFLKDYMRRFLLTRNARIRQIAVQRAADATG